jgi:hypothetical protein
MKVALLASVCSIVATSAALSASVTMEGNSTSIAAVTTAILLDAGVVLRDAGGGVFVLKAKNLHCDQHSNAAVDASDPRAAMTTVKCRIDSRNERGTDAGEAFGDGRAMIDLLQRAQAVGGGTDFADCAMGGYCGIFAKTIKCTIDTNIHDFGNGSRWSCVFDDGR